MYLKKKKKAQKDFPTIFKKLYSTITKETDNALYYGNDKCSRNSNKWKINTSWNRSGLGKFSVKGQLIL